MTTVNDDGQTVREKLAAHRDTCEHLANKDVPLQKDAQAILAFLDGNHDEP